MPELASPPRPSPVPPPALSPSLRASLSMRGRRVLVVEDEYMLAQDLAHELEEMGMEVLGPVPSVEDALALLAANAASGTLPDAAILDVNLMGKLAFSVADVLLARGVPFTFATGYDAQSIPAAYAHVPRCEKPFDVGQCLRALFE